MNQRITNRLLLAFNLQTEQPEIVLAVRSGARARAVASLRRVALSVCARRGRAGVLPLDVLPVLRAVLLALGVGRDVRGRLFGFISAHHIPPAWLGTASVSERVSATGKNN